MELGLKFCLPPRRESRFKLNESDNTHKSIIAVSAGKSAACSDQI